MIPVAAHVADLNAMCLLFNGNPRAAHFKVATPTFLTSDLERSGMFPTILILIQSSRDACTEVKWDEG